MRADPSSERSDMARSHLDASRVPPRLPSWPWWLRAVARMRRGMARVSLLGIRLSAVMRVRFRTVDSESFL